MKKLLSILAILAATAAVADDTVTSEAVFGILKVTISTQNTVIAAPWVGCDAIDNSQAIKVKDIVRTTGLSNGDKLFLYDGASYSKVWVLNNGVWEGANNVTVDDQSVTGGSDETINRGQSIVLSLNQAPANPINIYLYGKYDTSSTSVEIGRGSASEGEPVYHLVSPTKISENGVALNSDWISHYTNLTGLKNDIVFIPGKGFYGFVVNKGFGVEADGWDAEQNAFTTKFTAATVPPGVGFWYISKGGSGTINLQEEMTQQQ